MSKIINLNSRKSRVNIDCARKCGDLLFMLTRPNAHARGMAWSDRRIAYAMETLYNVSERNRWCNIFVNWV